LRGKFREECCLAQSTKQVDRANCANIEVKEDECGDQAGVTSPDPFQTASVAVKPDKPTIGKFAIIAQVSLVNQANEECKQLFMEARVRDSEQSQFQEEVAKTGELERQAAEHDREAAEKKRDWAETARTVSEGERVTSEQVRQQAEALRHQAEALRQAAEELRQTAEEVRQFFELERRKAQDDRELMLEMQRSMLEILRMVQKIASDNRPQNPG
jgi:colicin import membrane protein